MASSSFHRAMRRDHWDALEGGVYRLCGAPRTYEQKVMAATLAVRGSAACLRTAARILALPVEKFDGVEIAVAKDHRTLDGVTVGRVPHLDPADRSRVTGIPVTSVARTVLDLPAVIGRAQAAKVLDHVLARRLTTLKFLAGRLEALGAKGACREIAAQLIAERQGVKNHPDSWYQARLIEIITALGLDGWVQEHEIELPDGTKRRIDLAFVLIRLAIEVVSYLHHSQLVDWSSDQARNNQLTRKRWWMLYLTTYDIEHNPEAVGQEILQTIADLAAAPVTAA